MSHTKRTSAYTLVEMLVGMAIFFLLLSMLYMIFTRARFFENVLGAQSSIQYEARKGFLTLLMEVQESMAVVLPADGFTQPYMAIRDRTDKMTLYYLEKNAAQSAQEGFPVHDLLKSQYGGGPPRVLLHQVQSISFTAMGSGGVIVNLTVREKGREYPLVSMVRLKCLSALEAL